MLVAVTSIVTRLQSMEPRDIGLVVLLVGIIATIIAVCVWFYRVAQRRKCHVEDTKLSPEAQKAADKIGSGWAKKQKHSYTKVSHDDLEQGTTDTKPDHKPAKGEKLTGHDVAHMLYYFLAPFVLVGKILSSTSN